MWENENILSLMCHIVTNHNKITINGFMTLPGHEGQGGQGEEGGHEGGEQEDDGERDQHEAALPGEAAVEGGEELRGRDVHPLGAGHQLLQQRPELRVQAVGLLA